MPSKILTFLSDLEANNNREWYHAHKNERKEAEGEFEAIIQELILELGRTTPELLKYAPGELTFKLNRDTRFSHDKSPYNPSFRCHISTAGKLPVPVGYFLSIRPGNRSFLGGGLFADMFKDATNMVRTYINSHGEELGEILNSPEFRDAFKIQGTSLKNVPKEFEGSHPMGEYLKFKSWYIESPFEDTLLEHSRDFVDYACRRFLIMKPFNDYLNKALANFKMPER